MDASIPFNRPYLSGGELPCLVEILEKRHLSGDGAFTKHCKQWLEKRTGCAAALLTHSCTAALEMSALLANIQPGDEVIMPSYTFVSTANAFVLRGGVPVFVDIREDTLNIDETRIEDAVTPRTKAIAPIHYAGVGCEMDTILDIAARHSLKVIEDAAQGLLATYKGRALGTLGDMGTLSFHETKNIIAGEGGALLVNRHEDVIRGEIIREKGTDRSRFFRGEVDKYTWQEVGSSYLPAEIVAGFLAAQLDEADRINALRMDVWNAYHERLADLERSGMVRRPVIPAACEHNAHMYYLLLAPEINRQKVLSGLKERGIGAVFHYVPLHTAPAAANYCRVHGSMNHTEDLSERLVRLPLWNDMTLELVDRVVSGLEAVLRSI